MILTVGHLKSLGAAKLAFIAFRRLWVHQLVTCAGRLNLPCFRTVRALISLLSSTLPSSVIFLFLSLSLSVFRRLCLSVFALKLEKYPASCFLRCSEARGRGAWHAADSRRMRRRAEVQTLAHAVICCTGPIGRTTSNQRPVATPSLTARGRREGQAKVAQVPAWFSRLLRAQGAFAWLYPSWQVASSRSLSKGGKERNPVPWPVGAMRCACKRSCPIDLFGTGCHFHARDRPAWPQRSAVPMPSLQITSVCWPMLGEIGEVCPNTSIPCSEMALTTWRPCLRFRRLLLFCIFFETSAGIVAALCIRMSTCRQWASCRDICSRSKNVSGLAHLAPWMSLCLARPVL